MKVRRLLVALAAIPLLVQAQESDFEFAGIAFKAGDLVEYLRKAPGVSRSSAMKFRHLQKLQ